MQLFSISEVDVLIENALNHNPNLQQTLLTLKKAKQRYTVTSSDQWPNITANVNSKKVEDTNTAYTGSIDIAWTIDFWQKLANASDAEQANVSATAFAYQGAKDLLAANIISAYLDLVQLSQLIEIESQRVLTFKRNEQVIVSRYKKGLKSLNELDTAKSNTQSSEATLIEHKAQYQQSLRNISLLTGLQKNQITSQVQFPKIILPLSEIDADRIGQRPDLQQAYQDIKYSQYQHKVAYKALLPNISLSASISNSQSNLHDALFGSQAWQLLGQLSAPLFNAGKLTSEVEIAKLSAEQSYWSFQETLLKAVNEVDNAIAQEYAIVAQLTLIKSALASAKRSEITYTERYRQGTTSYIDLLQIQQQTFSLQTQVTQLTYQHLSNRISLGLALGLGI
nr:TolC family protein [Pseudoalteromonas sp. C2R02]